MMLKEFKLDSEADKGHCNGLTVVSQFVLIEHARLALMCHIGDPDAANSDTAGFQLLIHLIPHGFVELL